MAFGIRRAVLLSLRVVAWAPHRLALAGIGLVVAATICTSCVRGQAALLPAADPGADGAPTDGPAGRRADARDTSVAGPRDTEGRREERDGTRAEGGPTAQDARTLVGDALPSRDFAPWTDVGVLVCGDGGSPTGPLVDALAVRATAGPAWDAGDAAARPDGGHALPRLQVAVFYPRPFDALGTTEHLVNPVSVLDVRRGTLRTIGPALWGFSSGGSTAGSGPLCVPPVIREAQRGGRLWPRGRYATVVPKVRRSRVRPVRSPRSSRTCRGNCTWGYDLLPGGPAIGDRKVLSRPDLAHCLPGQSDPGACWLSRNAFARDGGAVGVIVGTDGTSSARDRVVVRFSDIGGVGCSGARTLAFTGRDVASGGDPAMRALWFLGPRTLFAAWRSRGRGKHAGLTRLLVGGGRAVMPVALPALAGRALDELAYQDVAERGGVLLVAGRAKVGSGWQQTLVAVRTDGAARSILSKPENLVWSNPDAGSGAQMAAISPGGAWVAYVARQGSGPGWREVLRVVSLAGAAVPRVALGKGEAPGRVGYVGRLVFVDDRHLVFAAGADAGHVDLFVYDVACGRVRRLIGSGRAAPPFRRLTGRIHVGPKGEGLRVWPSPNGRWLYVDYTQHGSSGVSGRIIEAVRLTDGRRILLDGLRPRGTSVVETCERGRVIAVVPARGTGPGRKGAVRGVFWNGDSPDKGVREFLVAGDGMDLTRVGQVVFGPLCRWLAVGYETGGAGSAGGGKAHIVVEALRGGKRRLKIDLSGVAVLSGPMWASPDGAWLVFGSAEPAGVHVARVADGWRRTVLRPVSGVVPAGWKKGMKFRAPYVWVMGVK